jgi:hypothetical protein
MKHLFRTIGFLSIVAMTLATASESSAQRGTGNPLFRDYMNKGANMTLCVYALSHDRCTWSFRPDSSRYVAEAKRRGFTIDACRQILGPDAAALAECPGPPKPNFANGACPEPLANAATQYAAAKALSELQNRGSLPFLSIQGILQAFADRLDSEFQKEVGEPSSGLEERALVERLEKAIRTVNLDTWKACFPRLATLLREENLRREAENQRKELERIEASKPINRLRQAYFAYIVVKKCYDVRLGYQLVYINEVEMERARLAISAIETSILKEDQSINASDAWQETVRLTSVSKETVEQYFCKKTYTDLLNTAPYSPPVKDFGSQSLTATSNWDTVRQAPEPRLEEPAKPQDSTQGQYVQQGPKLVGSPAAGSPNFGKSVALSADGNTAIVGAPNDNAGIGGAWVFIRTAGVWTQQGGKLLGSGALGGPSPGAIKGASQGTSVALSDDGNTAIIGGDFDNAPAAGSDDIHSVGAAWVFTRTAGVWTQEGPKLVGSGAVGGANQGRSVALSGDGNTAVVGGSNDNKNRGGHMGVHPHSWHVETTGAEVGWFGCHWRAFSR